jgi:hypothetical protein
MPLSSSDVPLGRHGLVSVLRIRDPVFLTPGSEMGKKSGSGSGMNNPNHISESIETIFWLKILYLNSLMRIQDPGWKKFGSGINIPDPQHCWSSTEFACLA